MWVFESAGAPAAAAVLYTHCSIHGPLDFMMIYRSRIHRRVKRNMDLDFTMVKDEEQTASASNIRPRDSEIN